MTSLVNDATILPKAPPTITAVAKLTISPFIKKDLNSFTILISVNLNVTKKGAMICALNLRIYIKNYPLINFTVCTAFLVVTTAKYNPVDKLEAFTLTTLEVPELKPTVFPNASKI